MKSFIVKNKAFVSLLTIALCMIFSLSIYIVQKQVSKPNVKESQDTQIADDPNKETQITALSGSYNRSSKDNVITVSWSYSEYNSKVKSAYLYLNDIEGINVTQNRYYDFPQSVYDYSTGDNIVRLVLTLDNGKTVEKEYTVFVKYIIRAKQEVLLESNVIKVTLEYVYDNDRPVSAPEILMTSSPEIEPVVNYINTETASGERKTTARSSFAFVWNNEADIPAKFSVRWKFNDILDGFDYMVNKPQSKVN